MGVLFPKKYTFCEKIKEQRVIDTLHAKRLYIY
jgi:cell division protein YceG involved in septum cleavage